MMKRIVAAAAVLALMAGAAHAQAKAEGVWMTPGGKSKVKIAPCAGQAGKLCGAIVWLKEPNDAAGQPKKDAKNEDAKLRDRPLMGLQLLSGFSADGDRWAGGQIYNPEDGKTYKSKLSLNADGTLKVEGCVVVICKAQTWTRSN